MIKKRFSEDLAIIDRTFSDLSVSKSDGMVFDVCVPKVWKRRKEVRKRPKKDTKTEQQHPHKAAFVCAQQEQTIYDRLLRRRSCVQHSADERKTRTDLR